MGSSVPVARELATDAVLRSRLYVDRRESAEREAGDYVIPAQDGAIGPSHIYGELGDVLIGKAEGRTDVSQITLFKSVGLGVEDVVAAHLVYQKAMDEGVGISVELGDQPDHAE